MSTINPKQTEVPTAHEDVAHAHERLTAFHIDLLKAIQLRDSSGQEAKAVVETLPGYEEVNHGRLYPNLDILVDLGLVKRGERNRRTNEYVITGKGNAVLDIRREWLDMKVVPDV